MADLTNERLRAEVERLRTELAQVRQWHAEVRQECAELRGEADDYLLERDSALAAAEHLHVLWQFARDFARTSGDGPSCECISCRAYRATRADALSGTSDDTGDGTSEGDQG